MFRTVPRSDFVPALKRRAKLFRAAGAASVPDVISLVGFVGTAICNLQKEPATSHWPLVFLPPIVANCHLLGHDRLEAGVFADQYLTEEAILA